VVSVDVGKNIKRLREERDWTQIQLSQKVGINNSVLSRIESGKRDVEDYLLVKFAEVFNVSTDYLLGRTDISNPTELTIDEELAQIMKDLGPDITLQFYDLKGMTDEEKENLKIFLQGLKARREQREGKQ
jgi:transcriptional regulator with XRE-family HTH domain